MAASDMRTLTDYEIYANLFASRAKSLGAYDKGTYGKLTMFNGARNLDSEFGFGGYPNGHSEQWNGTNILIGGYWRKLLSDSQMAREKP